MIAWTNIQDTLYGWANQSMGIPVIWRNQKGPQPPRPYATLVIAPPRKIPGTDALIKTTNLTQAGREIFETVKGQRELTATLEVWTNVTTGEGTAMAFLEMALTALRLPSYLANLYQGGLSVVDYETPLDLTDLVNETDFVSRAQVQIRFSCVDTAIDRTGYIAEAIVTPKIDGTTYPADTFVIE